MSGRARPAISAGARPSVLPTRIELVPWTDRSGHFDPLRAVVFALLLLPGLGLGARAALDALGGDPLNAAIHSAGYWAVWLLLVSLAITPARALSAEPAFVVVRRMIGNAALLYALLHLLLYGVDQQWSLPAILSEIVRRFYLTIGFVALLGLVVLGLTSTDGWLRRLKRGWKRLHRIVYGLMLLGLVHYALQSKLDVRLPLLAGGLYVWLMGWRVMPAGRDREWWPLALLSVVAAAATLGIEYGWYRLATRVDPVRAVRAELDPAFGLGPAGQVLLLGAIVTAATECRRIALTHFGGRLWFLAAMGAACGLIGPAVGWLTGWSLADQWGTRLAPWLLWTGFGAAGLCLGVAIWRLRRLGAALAVRWQVASLWPLAGLVQGMALAGFTGWSTPATCAAVVVIGAVLALGVGRMSDAAGWLMAPCLGLVAWVGVADGSG